MGTCQRHRWQPKANLPSPHSGELLRTAWGQVAGDSPRLERVSLGGMESKKREQAVPKRKFLGRRFAQENSSSTNAARVRRYQEQCTLCAGKSWLEEIYLVLKARCVFVGRWEAGGSGSSQGILDAAMMTKQLCLAWVSVFKNTLYCQCIIE